MATIAWDPSTQTPHISSNEPPSTHCCLMQICQCSPCLRSISSSPPKSKQKAALQRRKGCCSSPPPWSSSSFPFRQTGQKLEAPSRNCNNDNTVLWWLKSSSGSLTFMRKVEMSKGEMICLNAN